jgi:hypothetical protein
LAWRGADERVRRKLEEYCAMDTWAMVEIAVALRDAVRA